MAVTTNPIETLQARDDSVLSRNIGAADTTVYVAAQKKWVAGVETTGGFDTSAGFFMIVDGTGRFEYGSYDSKSVNATTFETTLSNVRRGLSPVTAAFTAGTGMAWDAGSRIFIVDYPAIWQNLVSKDTAQTITGIKTIDGTNPIRFNSSATEIWKDGSGNLTFKDVANGTKTLSDITAAAGTDEKAKISSNDTTQGYLNGKLVAGDGIAFTENNNGSNETLTVSMSLNPTDPALEMNGGFVRVKTAGNGITRTSSGLSLPTPTSGNILEGNGTTWTSVTKKYYDTIVNRTTTDGSEVAANTTSNQELDTFNYTAGAWAAGDKLRLEYWGCFVTSGALTTTLRPEIAASGTNMPEFPITLGGVDTVFFHLTLDLNCRTTGATGTVHVTGECTFYLESGNTSKTVIVSKATGSNNTPSQTREINTTSALALSLDIAFSAGSTSNKARVHERETIRSNATIF